MLTLRHYVLTECGCTTVSIHDQRQKNRENPKFPSSAKWIISIIVVCTGGGGFTTLKRLL